MNKSDAINELATALAKAQGQMKAAIKDAANPFFKSRYADMASVVDAIKGPLSANGLSYTQLTDVDEGGVYVETVLLHSSGQWISGRLKMPVAKDKDPQSLGSAITYCRRYALQALCGVPSDDDDGNAATGKPGVHRPTDGAMEGLEDKDKTRARTLASGLIDAWAEGDFDGAAEIWNACQETDVKAAAWGELGHLPAQRNKFKAFLAEREKAKKAA